MSPPRPSLARRALVAALVLGSFYVTTAVIALALLPLPILFVIGTKAIKPLVLLLVFACCWIPAYGLVTGLLGVRPPRFSEPGLPLTREDAPSLFAMIDELAQRAGTAPPHAVYVSALPVLFVCETGGGFFGAKSKRVLCIGAPYLATFTVDELRAVLAHELGHYLGGDTRVAGVLAYTEGAFRSVLVATERDALRDGQIHWAVDAGRWLSSAVGQGLVKLFAHVYLRLTRPMGRREELAADALSAELAGRETAIRALESAHVMGPLYELYLENEVAPVIDADVMPTDLLDGFARYRTRLAEHGKLAELTRLVGEQKTDPFDTHPALADRIAALRAVPPGPEHLVTAAARTLLDGRFDLDGWLVEGTASLAKTPPRQRMTWREIDVHVLPARIAERARETAARLFPVIPDARTLPQMLSSVVALYEAGRMPMVVAALEPEIAQVPPPHQRDVSLAIAGAAALTLFEGALLERGATLEDSLGERCRLFRYGGETVRAGLVAMDAMKNDVARAELARWARALAATEPAAVMPAIAATA